MPSEAAPAITTRRARPDDVEHLVNEGVQPLLARIFAARGVTSTRNLASDFEQLAAPDSMLNLRAMARLLANAIASHRKLLIVADYDADGATACAVGMRALRAYGAAVGYLVPNRFEYGYGLSPEIVRLAHAQSRPDILITVDNGIASFEGVAEANRLGMEVLITDHHLPAERLPEAACIINPNQPGCTFPSKHLAGVGVMFYLMLALRAELRDRGAFARRQKAEGKRQKEDDSGSSFIIHHSSFDGSEPNLAELLPLVALGTVADVVVLDHNNRILVQQGLTRIRAGRMQPGIAAMFQVAATWVSPWRRGSTRPAGSPTWRSASNASSPMTRSARAPSPSSSTASTGNGARSRPACTTRRWLRSRGVISTTVAP